MRNTSLKINEAIKILEYKKNNDKYWDKIKLFWQVIKKALPIAKALYFEYFLLFMFNNITSSLVYTENTLSIYEMNKKLGDKQIILYNN